MVRADAGDRAAASVEQQRARAGQGAGVQVPHRAAQAHPPQRVPRNRTRGQGGARHDQPGFCMRNNAAANVFNKDFDIRNYGVSRYLKIYLYDYDAVETLTDVQVRTNRDRCDGEEDVPSWFFEPGVTFLPEEIEAGLRVRNRTLRRAFRAAHADLMSVEYWEGLQQALRAGEVPGIHTFPESCHLRDWGAETVAIE